MTRHEQQPVAQRCPRRSGAQPTGTRGTPTGALPAAKRGTPSGTQPIAKRGTPPRGRTSQGAARREAVLSPSRSGGTSIPSPHQDCPCPIFGCPRHLRITDRIAMCEAAHPHAGPPCTSPPGSNPYPPRCRPCIVLDPRPRTRLGGAPRCHTRPPRGAQKNDGCGWAFGRAWRGRTAHGRAQQCRAGQRRHHAWRRKHRDHRDGQRRHRAADVLHAPTWLALQAPGAPCLAGHTATPEAGRLRRHVRSALCACMHARNVTQ